MKKSAPSGWTEGKLQDLVMFQRGFDITQEQQTPGDYPVISSSGITSYHSEFRVRAPGVVIGRKGTLGSIHYTERDYWPHDTTLWSKDFKGNVPRFVFYFLHTLDFKRFDVGNSNPTLNRNHIHDLDIRFPIPELQHRIAEVLTAYDELMENNRRRMALLEEAARQLYAEWFVRLRAPREPEVTNVDLLVTSENPLPKGWTRCPLGELCTFLNRGIAPHYDDNADGLVINQKCIRNGRLDMTLARTQSREFKPDRQIQVGDVLINSTGEGTLGRVAQVKAPIPNCTVDTHVTIARPKPEFGMHYIGQSVLAWEPRLSTMGRGATNQTELSRADIAAVEIMIPPPHLIQQFEQFAEPLYAQVVNLAFQTRKLRAARDLLLPPLMSGEIAV